MALTKSIELGGKTITLETGKLAKQANGAVMISSGDNYVLCTVTASEEAKPGQDFFPLTVDYREKTSAVGKIPGGFFKREARPTEKEILSSRLIDRPIRPLFPEGYFNEVQLLCSVYSSDKEYDSDIIAAIGGSAALLISDIPFDEPISEVRVTRIGGEFIINPNYKQIEEGDFDITIAGTSDSIMMVEGEGKEISEGEFLDAIKFGHKHITEICNFQKEFAKEAGKIKRELTSGEDISEMEKDVKEICEADLKTVTGTILSKEDRQKKNREIHDKVMTALGEKYPEKEKMISKIIHDIQYVVMRDMILNEGKRLDGRKSTEIRKIESEAGVLPRTHGSALFTRGQTQSLTTVTLGTKRDEQTIEGLKAETTKRFILHYNFPPFSTGEVGGRPGPGRREIGHGNLAERSLKNLLPSEEDFPYTIRVVSDILESNGSSSMATVCAGSIALMDAGVKLKKPIAGIAMGLILEGDKVAILSDILGDEDHFGDMDFKVAGTTEGITAIQMDIKIRGISFDIMEKALAQARDGRIHILGEMKNTLDTPRESISKYAPHLYSMSIPKDLIGAVIGPGGKMIRHIIAESGAEINIDDDGIVTIAAIDKDQAAIARKMIEGLTEIPEIGKIYEGKVKGMKDFGAFIEIIPGKEGLLHISEIDHKRVNKVEDVLKAGQMVRVKLMGIDDAGKLKLSRKALLPKEPVEAKLPAEPKVPEEPKDKTE